MSQVVVVPKVNGNIRLCVDMRRANEAVIRERYAIPTIVDILTDLNQSQVIKLDPSARKITTFQTHKGNFRYKRLMFGISCAPEMYNKIIHQILKDCVGVQSIFDDIIVHGKSQEEHDANLDRLFTKLREKGLKVNLCQCQFNLPHIPFMGYILSRHGIGVDGDKVKAVLEERQPSTATEIRIFLGLVYFSSRIIPNLATIAEPQRRLTRSGVKYQWESEHENAFKKQKELMAKSCTLAYFDPKAMTKVIAYTSLVGLGAVLVQQQGKNQRVICYASRSLTDVDRRYSQTEKEALALVWACESFHMYLYGKVFELQMDH